MSTTSTSQIQGAAGRLAIHRWGFENRDFVVVLLHGYAEHARRYEHVAQRLVEEGAAVYAPDHAGHGQSEGESALVSDVDDLVADLDRVVALARAEHPDASLVLLGHSMGAVIAVRYVQQRSPEVAALVLSGPVIGGNPDIEALLDADTLPDVPIDPSALSRDPEVGRAYSADRLIYHGPFKRPTLEALFSSIRAIATGPRLGEIATLWVHGELDPLAPIAVTREAVERIRGEHLEERVFEGALHEVLNETNRHEVLEAIVGFLAGVLTPGPADRP